MARTWTTADLEQWDERIRTKAEEFGLACFTQEFEVCDQEQMLGYMAYHGMPAQYPHWSFGKAYEKLKTLYTYGVSGLPYEMVINANPSLAYLMRDNSLCLQLLTISHVYGHNDFFRNNYMFRDTRPESTIGQFKLHADRIRGYLEDPSIGPTKVEETLDAAHALSLQCRRHTAIRKLSADEQRERALDAARPAKDPYARIHKPQEYREPDLSKVPLEPEEDLLAFIAAHNPYLAEWQRDLLRIVHGQSQYFLPQIETKIMNEGWACYWHHKIMSSLELPDDLHIEFLVNHNQVVRPHVGNLNPYHVGFILWHDLAKRHGGDAGSTAPATLFEVRESERDVSFLRRFLTRELMEEMHMFEYQRQEDALVVSRVVDEDDWEAVKQTLLKNIGMNTVPVIRVIDADFGHNRTLRLEHEHDGRDLDLDHMERTLKHVHRLWSRPVLLDTRLKEEAATFSQTESGFERMKN
ncbi:MAG: stage V sporulation protein R [Candidatus Muproteobacteria bacterium RBG_16_60_9]|uniref:Stage V sporulation protein R n=1 Tax=Candidatus Muproteobacteria bacterium RBG_16_60_9 TaxID=1817755 RepID=A0A1F6VAW0_9PROT|nr:MAG: stage V sporulation protein R [Candidatus Muproteobacteria bacterium RBG_16_60_9]